MNEQGFSNEVKNEIKKLEQNLRAAAMRGCHVTMFERFVNTPENMNKPEKDRKTEYVLRITEPVKDSREPNVFEFVKPERLYVLREAADAAKWTPERFVQAMDRLNDETVTRFERWALGVKILLHYIACQGAKESEGIAIFEKAHTNVMRFVYGKMEFNACEEFVYGKGPLTPEQCMQNDAAESSKSPPEQSAQEPAN